MYYSTLRSLLLTLLLFYLSYFPSSEDPIDYFDKCLVGYDDDNDDDNNDNDDDDDTKRKALHIHKQN